MNENDRVTYHAAYTHSKEFIQKALEKWGIDKEDQRIYLKSRRAALQGKLDAVGEILRALYAEEEDNDASG